MTNPRLVKQNGKNSTHDSGTHTFKFQGFQSEILGRIWRLNEAIISNTKHAIARQFNEQCFRCIRTPIYELCSHVVSGGTQLNGRCDSTFLIDSDCEIMALVMAIAAIETRKGPKVLAIQGFKQQSLAFAIKTKEELSLTPCFRRMNLPRISHLHARAVQGCGSTYL